MIWAMNNSELNKSDMMEKNGKFNTVGRTVSNKNTTALQITVYALKT